MTILSKSATTSTTLASIWRKFQAPLYEAINTAVPEVKRVQEMKDAKFLPTTREVLFPMRLRRGGGIGSTAESGYKGVPSTAAPVDGSATLVHYTGRIMVPIKIKIIDSYAADAQIKSQLVYSAKDKAIGMSEHIGTYFYAPSTAILATTSTSITGSASTTLTLANGLNQSWITNAAYIARPFTTSDRIAVLLNGVLVTNATGAITAVSSTTPSITVTWDGTAPNITTTGLQIVKCNTMDNTANDYNNGLVANAIDIPTVTSLHGLTTAEFEWQSAFSDTTGGRLTYVRIENGVDQINNFGPGAPDTLLIDQGVKRDLRQNYEGQGRFDLGDTIKIDGDLDVGLEIFSTKRVPPTMALIYRQDDWQMFFGKPPINENGTEISEWGDLYQSEDQMAVLGDINWVGNLVCRARRSFAFWRSLQTQ